MLEVVGDVLSLAIESVEAINKKTLPRALKAILKDRDVNKWNLRLQELSVQCKFNDACVLEKDNGVWNRIMQGLPAGQLPFQLRAASDILPTPLNLKRWRFRVDGSCPLCSSPSPTTLHILNGCPLALSQGRYTWRHDSVLVKLLWTIKMLLSPEDRIYGDLSSFRASDNPLATVPPEIVVTSARPDMVVVRNCEILLIELTVPYNSPESIANAHSRKEAKENYNMLLDDLEAKGYSASLLAIEIGSLGHSLTSTQAALSQNFPSLSKQGVKKLFDKAGKVAISASYFIFLARRDQLWNSECQLLS